jgi:peptidoglycan/xylan/chitin deacetylase (PgdA/CDA1 family)
LGSADDWLAEQYVRWCAEGSSLIAVVFHKLFLDRQELALDLVDPQNETTVDDFRRLIHYFLAHGYTFVSPDDILSRLRRDRKYVYLTFDDGYFNNQRALPVLAEFGVPATIMVATGQVLREKAYWWDVVFREGRKRGVGLANIASEQRRLMLLPPAEIDAHLEARFGLEAMRPISEIDRPFTPGELKQLSSDSRLSFGNHTSNHPFLPNCSPDTVRSEILSAQDALREMTGTAPRVIAYPYGAYTPGTLAIAKEAGLRVGMTGEKEKNGVPLRFEGTHPLQLKRFTLWGNRNIEDQCARYRSDLHLLARARRVRRSLRERG